MAKIVKITGVNRVLGRMRKATKGYASRAERGLKNAGLFVQSCSQRIVPVDLGNLKGTAATDNIGGKGFKTDIVVHYGAGADYAVYVHENLDARHKPGKQAKFLELVVRRERSEIFRIIAKG